MHGSHRHARTAVALGVAACVVCAALCCVHRPIKSVRAFARKPLPCRIPTLCVRACVDCAVHGLDVRWACISALCDAVCTGIFVWMSAVLLCAEAGLLMQNWSRMDAHLLHASGWRSPTTAKPHTLLGHEASSSEPSMTIISVLDTLAQSGLVSDDAHSQLLEV